MSESSRIIAIGLLTQRDLGLLGRGFDRAFPVDPAPCFEDLVRAIDDAELKLERCAPSGRKTTGV